MNKASRLNYLLKFISVCLLISPVANSFELSADLFTSARYSNNVELASTATKDDISQTLGLNVLLKENRKRFNADASFNLEEEHYYNNSFSSQTSLTAGFGIFNFDIIDNFLNWRTSFTRTEVLKNASDIDTPDNREQRNILRSGPSITYRINRGSTLALSSNYTLVENSDEDAADTKRIDSTASYSYALNRTTSVSMNSQYDEILDGDGDEELKNININFGFIKRLSNGSFQFNYGQTEAKSGSNESEKGNFFDISFNQNKLFSHNWMIQYNQDISDTSIGFESDEEGFNRNELDNNTTESEGVSADSASAAGLDILQQKSLSLSVSRLLGAVSYSLSGFWRYENFKTQNDDLKSRGVGFNITHNIAPNFNVGASCSFLLDEYLDQPTIKKDKINRYGVNGQYGLTKKLNVSTYLEYEIRANSHNQSREYEVLTTGFTLSFALL